MSLPVPIGRQKEVLYLPASGHTVVLGTAGSGKTALAILRAAYLADPETDHRGKTLLLTFNKTLITYIRHLAGALGDVVVENYHTFARGYLSYRQKLPWGCICEGAARDALISQAIANSSLEGQPIGMIGGEFAWIAQNGYATEDDYLVACTQLGLKSRTDANYRTDLFRACRKYGDILRATGRYLYDWDDIATAVSRELDMDTSTRRYRHVVIDEGQDFSPAMIRSLAKALQTGGSLTFLGDMAQQIYGYRLSWRDAGLDISEPWYFEENYRNSRQVARLALAISDMPYFAGTADLVVPKAPPADGPPPVLVCCRSAEDELAFVAGQALALGRTQSVGLLVRNRADVGRFAQRLGRGTRILSRNLTAWDASPGIYCGTYHSSKGLEFDAVFLPLLDESRLPEPQEVATLGLDEATRRDGKLLYVGVSRARRVLIMTHSNVACSLLPPAATLYQEQRR